MSGLSSERIRQLVSPYYPGATNLLIDQLGVYLDLLLRWNERLNLTAIRTSEAIVERHFGESLFLARHLPPATRTLLDLGSGAGFPGLPVQLALPELKVTLAESQQKKASFLREVVRELDLSTEVWSSRAETLPAARTFDVVAMRAVDNTPAALRLARRLVSPGGTLAHLTSRNAVSGLSLEVTGTQAFYPLAKR